MAKINILFNGTKYSIDSTKLADAKSALAAHFKALEDASDDPTPYTVTLTTNNSEAGTVEFTSNGHSGTSASLTGEQTLTFKAVSNSGYQFVGWYVGETLISTDAVYTAGYTVSSETTIEARFIEQTITPFTVTAVNRDKVGYTGEMDENLVIPETFQDDNGISYRVTAIGELAFDRCRDLISITLPASVTFIDDYAFDGCDNLTTITVLAETPPTLDTSTLGDGMDDLAEIRVPATSVDAYKAAYGWKKYTEIIVAID